MYGYDTYGREPTWARILRQLSSTFRVGVFFGVEVRMYWAALALPLYFVFQLAMVGFPLWMALLSGTALSAILFAIIYTHEMSHIAAGWRYRIPTRLITLSPLGGVAHMSGSAPHPRAEIHVALAGPLVHLPWLVVAAGPYFFLLPRLEGTVGLLLLPIIVFLWQANLALMIFNLLPFFPLDGGRVLRALLAMRMHPNRATLWAARVGIGGGILLILFGIFGSEVWGVILVLIGITSIMACRDQIRLARHTASPYGGGQILQPWESDPDAWKGGPSGAPWRPGGGTPGGTDRKPRQPGLIGRWKEKQKRRREIDRALQAEQERAEVDRILAKVSDVGVGGLSDDERKFLKKVSRK